MKKRGQGLSTNAIILIILGVVILAILIVGFAQGWNLFKEKINTEDNVNTIVQQCQTACASSNIYDYCSRQLTLVAPDLPGDVKEVSRNCSYFATSADYQQYGVPLCGSLCD